jgi:uncharacterized tellurite resistance protein B-like protein
MGLRDLFNRSSAPDPAPEVSAHDRPLPTPTSRSASSTPTSQTATSWVPSGGLIVVDGRRIDSGMVYFGTRVLSIDQRSVEPALIDPTLPVAWNNADHTGSTMGYWPSYSEIDARSRAGYLSWLADGRRHPGAYVGHVFLFLYGLERRLLIDHADDLDAPEVDALLEEVRRLVRCYPSEYSFVSYAKKLILFVDGIRSVVAKPVPPAWDPDYPAWEMPTSVLAGVGRYVAAGEPLPDVWALAFLRYHPEAYLRTPATRCIKEFDELFKLRYRKRFGDGLKVRASSKKLVMSYRPSSGGFPSEVTATFGDLPDISEVSGPITKLKELATEITEELDAYSRFLGRNADGAGTPAAVALLPDELLESHGGAFVEALRSWVGEVLDAGGTATVTLDDVLAHSSPGRTDKLTKRDAVSVAALLHKLGVGIEPDVRFGASTPAPGSDAVLFWLPDGASTAPSAAYTAAMSLVHLTAMVAASDGTISKAEQAHLATHAEQVLGLDAAERIRLEAHLAFMGTGKVSMAGVKRKVDDLPLGERVQVGRFLIDVAAADGVVSPAEITTLTKLFGHLGLEEGDVYRQVHGLGSGDPGPVTVRPGEPTERWTIPAPGEEPPLRPVMLDASKVQARLAETAHVTALLTNIFAADDNPAAAPSTVRPLLASPAGPAVMLPPPGSPVTASATEPSADSGRTVAGLNAVHSHFAIRLAEQSEWARADAEQIAAELGLTFLDAALEVVNDAAFEACGEPFAEGDDPVEMNSYAIEEMLS